MRHLDFRFSEIFLYRLLFFRTDLRPAERSAKQRGKHAEVEQAGQQGEGTNNSHDHTCNAAQA